MAVKINSNPFCGAKRDTVYTVPGSGDGSPRDFRAQILHMTAAIAQEEQTNGLTPRQRVAELEKEIAEIEVKVPGKK